MTARKLEEYLLDGARVQRPQNTDCEIGAFEVNECADGINNDSDAFIDGADLGCRDGTSVREDPQCQEGINNDPGQDPDPGLIDFDGGLSALGYVASDPDPQCVGLAWKNKERNGLRPGLLRAGADPARPDVASSYAEAAALAAV
jgi:hypothetical protein